MTATDSTRDTTITEARCQLVELRPLNHDVSLLRLRLENDTGVDWRAGQYARLKLDQRWLPFSIANAPSQHNQELQFHFRHLAHHASAQHNLEWLQQHRQITLRLPQGDCFLQQPDEQRPIWFICGSTGFAQAHAMLSELAANGHQGPLKLFWGAHSKADFYLPDAPQRLQEKLPGLEVGLALSGQPQPNHFHGLVHQQALQQLDKPQEPLFFISGSPAMVDVVATSLQEAGVARCQLMSDML